MSRSLANGPVLIVAGFAPSLLRFRGELIRAIRGAGRQVCCVAPEDDPEVRAMLRTWGVDFVRIPIQRSRVTLLGDLQYLLRMRRLCLQLRPELVLAYTVKPVVFGLIAARLAGIHHRFALITGLGYAFLGEGQFRRGLRSIVTLLYRTALRDAKAVFFQNPDDREQFVSEKIVAQARAVIVNGSGVDTAYYAPAPFPTVRTVFLLIARLVEEKGVREYVAAARAVKERAPNVEFRLVGPVDPSDSAIPLPDVQAWQAEGVVTYSGEVSDVRPEIAGCSVYVLPSYREGTPRTNLEAMAMGRAVITTDAPGCRETVVDGVNGFLVSAKDPESLASAMLKFVDEPSLIARMGAASRRIVEEKYDVHQVNRQMLSVMGLL